MGQKLLSCKTYNKGGERDILKGAGRVPSARNEIILHSRSVNKVLIVDPVASCYHFFITAKLMVKPVQESGKAMIRVRVKIECLSL